MKLFGKEDISSSLLFKMEIQTYGFAKKATITWSEKKVLQQ